MAKLLLLFLLFFISFSDATSIIGNWMFDFKSSVEKMSKLKPIYSKLEGMQIQIESNGKYTITEHGAGEWRKEGDSYILSANNGKKMHAKLLNSGLLQITQQTRAGKIPLVFRSKPLQKYNISNYLYINSIYKQKQKVYDNGYLYYLFLSNGIFYSYASPKTTVSVDEIKKSGDKLKYRFLGDKIVMKGPFKVVIKTYKKQKIVTSQGDILYLQQ